MFFSLSKIFWLVFSPLNLVFILILSGLLITKFFSKGLGRLCLGLGIMLFIILGVFPTGTMMIQHLENRYQAPKTMPERITGFVVLGGAMSTNLYNERGVHTLNQNAERVTETLRLSREYPDAIIMLSGGNGTLKDTNVSESIILEDYLVQMGMSKDNILLEDQSRNTFENIILSRNIIIPQPDERWFLITSAYHMPRAMAVAKAWGWGEIIPFPVDFRTKGSGEWKPSFHILGNFEKAHLALKEYIGFIAYYFSGKIGHPLP